MFDIGFSEFAFIFVIALLVFGPKRIPELARTVGQWYAKILKLIQSTKADIQKEFDLDGLLQEVQKQKEEIRRLQYEITHVKQDIEEELKEDVLKEKNKDKNDATE